MTRAGWTRGRTVIAGELQYVSPSQIVSADHESFGGCLRRWFYRKVEGRDEPEGTSQKTGTQGHAEIEEYLTTGKMVLGQHALSAKRFLPAPSPDLQVELDIDDGTLTLAGLPVVGYIDWLNTSGTVHLDHGEHEDPPNSAEVVDWKFTGRKDFPSAQEVATALPMVLYGEWVARKYALEHVRLSHTYISTRRREASKRSLLVPRSEFGEKIERAEGIVRRLIQAAGSTANEVDANTDACTAYGVCPHRAYCTAGEHRTLVDLLGAEGAARILKQPEKDMSLLNIPALAALQKPDPVADERAKLIAEEQAAKVDPAIKAAVDAILASGYGQPTLTGPAALAWAAALDMKGVLPGTLINGQGLLKDARFSDPADLVKAADELKGMPAPAANTAALVRDDQGGAMTGKAIPTPAQAAGLLPPDAPVSDPVAAAAKLEPKAEPAKAEPGDITQAKAAVDTTATSAAQAEDTGELKLSKKARAFVESLQAKIAELEAEHQLRDKAATTTAPAPAVGIDLYVDCFPPAGARDLMPWVHDQADSIAKQYGAPDVRCGADGTPIAFGKWRGVLAAVCRQASLEDGAYFLDARGSDLAEIAAEALRTRAKVTRGIR